MSTTRDWMRHTEEPEGPELKSRPLRSVLIWVAVVAVVTFVALAIRQMIG